VPSGWAATAACRAESELFVPSFDDGLRLGGALLAASRSDRAWRCAKIVLLIDRLLIKRSPFHLPGKKLSRARWLSAVRGASI
jgi:hypothetical protein